MALLDSKQDISLDLTAQKPIAIELKVGQKVVFIALVIAATFLIYKVKG
jgi:hypothetical protein